MRLLAEYSEKLNGDNNETGANRISFKKDQLDEFIRYLPVLKISGNGMVDMNANNVHSFGVSGLTAVTLLFDQI